jgi:outer membrane murein-binding lipoprotein Lpp
VRRRFATLFIFAAAVASASNLSSCGGEAKEDPAENQQREVQQQVQQPEQTQPTQVEQTDRTIGEDIQG